MDASGCCRDINVSLGYQGYPLLIFPGSSKSVYTPVEVCGIVITRTVINNEIFM